MKITRTTLFLVSTLFASIVSAESIARTPGGTPTEGALWKEGGRSHEYKFRTVSPPGGFSYDGVTDVVKDGDGFVWALFENDLIRLDGYGYKRYASHFKAVSAGARLLFHTMKVDSEGRLYVSCAHGLFRYDRLTDSFERLLDRSYLIFPDAHDNIWVRQGTRIGVVRGADSLEVKFHEGKPVSDVYAAVMCDDGSFFVGTYYGRILRYDHSAGTFSAFHTFPGGHYITRMQCSGDDLWVLLRDNNLVVIDIPSGRIKATHDFPTTENGFRAPIRDMLIDRYGDVWVATQRGIWLLDPRTGERRLYRHSSTDIFSIPNDSVWTIMEDPDGNIWIGTFSGGLCMVNIDEHKSFTTYVKERSDLSHNTVSAFTEDEHAFWIGTEGGGVNRLDKSTERFTHIIRTPSGAESSPRGNHVKSLVRDGRNRLWIATYLNGMMSYDIRTGAFRYFNDRGPERERLLHNSLRKIVPEGDTGLWIAYQSDRYVVSFLPYDGGAIEHYDIEPGESGWYILDICRSGDYLWIVTQQKLYRMDVRDRSIAEVSLGAMPVLDAQSLCADARGNVWVGTVSGTVLRYDAASGEFTTIAGLADHNALIVYSICFDGGGALWMGTDNGLFRYDVDTGGFSRFDESDGAQGRMYYPLASMLARSGDLLFGGTNGFSIVDPRAISVDDRLPRVIVSEYSVNNSPAVPRLEDEAPGTYYGREAVLSHRETNFGFRLASDNYATPSKTRFRYMLRGYDPAPLVTGADSRTVLYSNVPAGTYTFEVSASSDGKRWGEPIGVKVVRRPAPWNGSVAWTLYVAVLLSVVGTIVYYRVERRRLAMRLYLDGIDKQKRDELHQSQLRFFTNISHDFRTPLSLILGAVDNLRRSGHDDRYHRIVESNSQRLLGLVNELMDFRTVENGMMRLNVQLTDVNRLVRDISADFHDFAREKQMDFRVDTDGALSALVPVDRAVVEKIVMNLLNNAFKYTPRGGSITISTHAASDAFGNRFDTNYRIEAEANPLPRFAIAVGDTGVGISRESIAKVFERFYKVNAADTEQHLGTGIGLALVKSLVLLHKGAITIFSERDKGTDMVVELPFDGAAYTEEEFPAESHPTETTERDERLDTTRSAAESMLLRTRKRILLVEDNDDLRMLIADFLSTEYEVVQSVDGIAASEWLDDNDADLIVSDIMMPRKDGVTLLREVKENIATSHIPFVLLTSKTDAASKLEGAGAGADLYFEKPVDLNLLALSLGNIFSRQSKLREFYSKNYFVENGELSQNEHDNAFLKKLVEIIDRNLDRPVIDVSFIASELSMSHRKLYSKLKTVTGKSVIEFILDYRMRKAARLIIEEDMSIQQVMESVGIKSQSYFTRMFREAFDQTPSAFAKAHGKRPANV